MDGTLKPILLGCAGLTLSLEERGFFARANPLGFILFARNCDNPQQLRKLTRALRDAVGRADAPIFIDQEGGRVARLKPPCWPKLPAAGALGALYEKDWAAGAEAMRLHATITARMLTDVGIDGNCTPVLDLAIPNTSSVMGDRTFSSEPQTIIALGLIAIKAYLHNGVLPIIKHMPGHGRVKVDPHEVLPFVDTDLATLQAEDFVPFCSLAKEAPIGMNCHVVFRAIDPALPVSLSRKAHDEILRGALGFDGLIFSDGLEMKALALPLEELGVRALEAGADVGLYCTGVLEENRAVCSALPAMSEAALSRWAKAQSLKRPLEPQPQGQEFSSWLVSLNKLIPA